jgi:hypothetical protein
MGSRIPVVLSCCSSAKKKSLINWPSSIVILKILKKASQRSVARSVNFIMTAAYWQIGRCIVEFEQKGQVPAEYGEKFLEQLTGDLSARFGRGFSYPNLNRFRQFSRHCRENWGCR